jgi:hypothetical protein
MMSGEMSWAASKPRVYGRRPGNTKLDSAYAAGTASSRVPSTLSPTTSAACTRRASASGSPVRTPTNASSQPSTSTTAPSMPRSTAMTCAEAASYAAASTGRMTAVGALRAASRNGMPDPTPNARAS